MGIRVRSNYTDIVTEPDPVHTMTPFASPAQSWRGTVTVDGYKGKFVFEADFPAELTLKLRLRFLYGDAVYRAGRIITLTPEAGALDTNGDSMILGKLFDLIAVQLATEHPKCMFEEGPCSN